MTESHTDPAAALLRERMNLLRGSKSTVVGVVPAPPNLWYLDPYNPDRKHQRALYVVAYETVTAKGTHLYISHETYDAESNEISGEARMEPCPNPTDEWTCPGHVPTTTTRREAGQATT